MLLRNLNAGGLFYTAVGSLQAGVFALVNVFQAEDDVGPEHAEETTSGEDPDLDKEIKGSAALLTAGHRTAEAATDVLSHESDGSRALSDSNELQQQQEQPCPGQVDKPKMENDQSLESSVGAAGHADELWSASLAVSESSMDNSIEVPNLQVQVTEPDNAKVDDNENSAESEKPQAEEELVAASSLAAVGQAPPQQRVPVQKVDELDMVNDDIREEQQHEEIVLPETSSSQGEVVVDRKPPRGAKAAERLFQSRSRSASSSSEDSDASDSETRSKATGTTSDERASASGNPLPRRRTSQGTTETQLTKKPKIFYCVYHEYVYENAEDRCPLCLDR